MEAEIGIIGGTGVYDPKLLENVQQVNIDTKFGSSSGPITLGEINGRKIAFINRHGQGHTIPPHKVNYRANIWALKELGVERILAPVAVGSLKEMYKPGDIVICDQFIDFTKKRDYTFFDEGKVYHVSTADPFCGELRRTLVDIGKSQRVPMHETGAYVCIEGPRFSTKAESMMFRNIADVIGMTLVPECVLAREAEICYAPIATVTDFDVWSDKPVSTDEIIQTMKGNLEKVRLLLSETIPKIPVERNCLCKDALKDAGV
ncbi:S-methyl-5'-thioadenosine phosphorylase [archaeon]|nr:MAG: S-methyl-5'-thioadenosine phosphorylase [archaeon]